MNDTIILTDGKLYAALIGCFLIFCSIYVFVVTIDICINSYNKH